MRCLTTQSQNNEDNKRTSSKLLYYSRASSLVRSIIKIQEEIVCVEICILSLDTILNYD